jgi:hypothetical protein
MIYKLVKSDYDSSVNQVLKIDGTIIYSIPFDESNRDYQAYLKWLAEGNTPEPADE